MAAYKLEPNFNTEVLAEWWKKQRKIYADKTGKLYQDWHEELSGHLPSEAGDDQDFMGSTPGQIYRQDIKTLSKHRVSALASWMLSNNTSDNPQPGTTFEEVVDWLDWIPPQDARARAKEKHLANKSDAPTKRRSLRSELAELRARVTILEDVLTNAGLLTQIDERSKMTVFIQNLLEAGGVSLEADRKKIEGIADRYLHAQSIRDVIFGLDQPRVECIGGLTSTLNELLGGTKWFNAEYAQLTSALAAAPLEELPEPA